MYFIANVIELYVDHKDKIDFFKDIVFAIGVIATFYGYFKVLKFLAQRKILYKKQEMENDARLYSEIHPKLKEYVDDYGVSEANKRDIGVRLLFIKNYPYKLEDDGFPQMLYYYFLSENHKASGYISGKGIYVMDYLRYFGNSIYYNPKNKKWFIDKKGLSFKKYGELKHQQLVKRIPFAHIYGYDFDSDWADKGEPVFYTKYKYHKWKLFADDLDAVNVDDKYHLASKLQLQKSRRARKVRSLLRRLKNILRGYLSKRKRIKLKRLHRINRNKSG